MSDETARSRQRKWQLKQRAAGLCVHCGKRPICAGSKNFCATDRKRLNARRRRPQIDVDASRKTA